MAANALLLAFSFALHASTAAAARSALTARQQVGALLVRNQPTGGAIRPTAANATTGGLVVMRPNPRTAGKAALPPPSSRLSGPAEREIIAEAARDAARRGDTRFAVNVASANWAARQSRAMAVEHADEAAQASIRAGIAPRVAAAAAAGAAAEWATTGAGGAAVGRASQGLRAGMASEATQTAIRASLDRLNDAYRATQAGAPHAGHTG